MTCKYEGGGLRWMVLVLVLLTCVCNKWRLARIEHLLRDRLPEVHVKLEVK